jgi:sugar transferase (PEP-CTERM system associated)
MALALALVETAALFAAAYLVMALGKPFSQEDVSVALLGQAMAICVCCLVSFYYNDMYDLRIVRRLRDFVPRLAQSLFVTVLLLAIGGAVLPGATMGGAAFATLLLAVIGLVVPVRALGYGLLERRKLAQQVLVLGTSPLARKIAAEIEATPHLGFAVGGFIAESSPGESPYAAQITPPGARVWALDQLCEVVKATTPDYIVVALAERRGRLPVWTLLATCREGVRVVDGLEFYERITQKLAIENLSPSAVIFSEMLQKPRYQRALRRAVNVALSLLGLLATLPIMAVVAALVKLESAGGAFFVQERTGLGGRTFNLIKFRTMRPARAADGPDSVWRRDDEARVTRLGRWLRRSRIDELPQFLNILKGDMDLIGPRPEMACNVAAMTERIPYYPLRHSVRPGVTGWAQINQGYSVSEAEVTEKVRFDLYYIKHMSLWLDLRILIDTVKIVLFGRGAR